MFFTSSARWTGLLLIGALAAGVCICRPAHDVRTVHGRVSDAHGPVAAARVGVQGGQTTTFSDAHGRFRLQILDEDTTTIAAWKAGYRIGSIPVFAYPLELKLEPLPAEDNEDYSWIDPQPDPKQAANCGNCHGSIYEEWRRSAHGHSARNPRFLSLYAGPEKTWNLQREHPLGAGVCAACHAPTLTDPGLDYDMSHVKGVAAEGVHCDFCHKVADAPVDKLGTRFGRDGLVLLRPPVRELFFFGPLIDAVRAGESFAYSPLYKESRYCASCHEGVVFGVHVYGTYSEWLASPARAAGQQCQHCHMAPSDTMTNIAPGKGGVRRDPYTLASHALPGSGVEMLRRCLQVKTTSAQIADKTRVTVEILAQNVGHRVPTGFIDRNLLLVVEATGAASKPLGLIEGAVLPPSAGKELAGQAGRLFAKQLHAPGERVPIPFWLPHGEMTDTRLFPGRPERFEFTFPKGVEQVRTRLIYRRFWQDVAEERGWTDNGIVVSDETAIRSLAATR